MRVMKMKHNWDKTFTKATEVLSIIEENGYEAYFVGGCVRDYLLDRPVQDIDIASSALPEEVMTLFDHVIPVGIVHGTVIVRYKKTSYEVTTFRHDGTYNDQRHPDHVTYVRSINDDLQRRDFTINAIAMNRHGEIIDLFSGRKDLANQIIRTVGNAHDRFTEDPLRILRGIRFTSQLGFALEENTYIEMEQLKDSIETVAIERVTDELEKLFKGEFIQTGITYLVELELHFYIPIWKDNPSLLNKLPKHLSPFVSFAEVITLFHYLDPTISISTWSKAWKCSNKTKHTALQLMRAMDYYIEHGIDHWLVYILPKEAQTSFQHFVFLIFEEKIDSAIVQYYEQLPITNRNQLKIDGHDLQQLFRNRKRGKWIREYIEKIEYEIVMGRLLNTKKAIKEWILCHLPDKN